MKPGEYFLIDESIELNSGRKTVEIGVTNSGDRPVQVGSHYHFAETNSALIFDRPNTFGYRLNIAAGTAVRFEPGVSKTVELVDYGGSRNIFGFRGEVMGTLEA